MARFPSRKRPDDSNWSGSGLPSLVINGGRVLTYLGMCNNFGGGQPQPDLFCPTIRVSMKPEVKHVNAKM